MTRPAAAALAGAAAVCAIYALRLDHAAGLIVDDGWYIILARALAQGDGYRLISSAATEILPAVPPGFPAILSLVVRVRPEFPDNVVWLKLVSIAAMAGVGVACWIDATRYRAVPRGEAALLVGATLIAPALVFLATSTVMAEPVFMLAQVVAVILVERTAREDPVRPAMAHTMPILAAAVAVTATLIRSAGMGIIAAAVAYLVLARRWRQAAVFAIASFALLAPWQLYARAHAPTPEESAAHGGTIAYSYQRLLTMARLNDPTSPAASTGQMIERAQFNLAGVASRDVGAVLVPAFYRGPSESGEEVVSIGGPRGGSMGAGRPTMVISLVLCGILAVGAFRVRREWLSMPVLVIAATLAMVAPVGGQTFRYIVPLTPYFLLFFWRALGMGAVARIALLCLVGFNLSDHASYIHQRFTATTDWLEDARENEELLSWMAANLKEPGAVATTNPALVYLRTGRKTVASVRVAQDWSQWRAIGVRYVVSTLGGDLPPQRFNARLLYQTSRRGLWVVEMP